LDTARGGGAAAPRGTPHPWAALSPAPRLPPLVRAAALSLPRALPQPRGAADC
jgi:hypothetical protein